MTRISPSRVTPPPSNDDEAAITKANASRFSWKTALLWLLRISAIMCMARAITYWMELLGIIKIDFNDRVTFQQIAIVFFAGMYCFASSGLWMAASWGIVVWVITLMGEAAMWMLEPKLSSQIDFTLDASAKLSSMPYLLLGIIGVLCYILLSWLIDREEVQENT